MSTFWLKGIALVAMTLDHLGLVFGQEGWNLLPLDSSWLRAIGRTAFPLFAFCLAQGWHRTHNRKHYFLNLALGASISQVPFSMAFYPANLMSASTEDSVVSLEWPYLGVALMAVWAYWHFVLKKRRDYSLLLVAITALIPGLRLKVAGFWILCPNTNVFYTFLVAFFCLCVLVSCGAWTLWERFAICLVAPIFLVGYGIPADYGTGLLGVVLIVGFAAFPKKSQQIALLILWSILYYGFFVCSIRSAIFCSLAALGIVWYNPKSSTRLRAKKLFYWYYPAHLFLLGLFNAMLRYRP